MARPTDLPVRLLMLWTLIAVYVIHPSAGWTALAAVFLLGVVRPWARARFTERAS